MKKSILIISIMLTMVMFAQRRDQLNDSTNSSTFQNIIGKWTMQPGGKLVEFTNKPVENVIGIQINKDLKWYSYNEFNAEGELADNGMVYTILVDDKTANVFLITYKNESFGPMDPIQIKFTDKNTIIAFDRDNKEKVIESYTRVK